MSAALPTTLSEARAVFSFGRTDGHVAVVALQDFTVRATVSGDAGRTFGPGVIVAGGPGQSAVIGMTAAAAPEGTIHVALAVLDPAGDVGLSVTSSADGGTTWSAPLAVVHHGMAAHGITGGADEFAIACGASGEVAVLFAQDEYDHYSVTLSRDAGLTWTAPVRVDSGIEPFAGSATHNVALAIDAAGTVHVAFVQKRSAYANAWYTRSTDHGATFESPRSMGNTGRTCYGVDLALVPDGSLLIAWSERTAFAVARSTDGGATFSSPARWSTNGTAFRPAIASGGTSTVLVACNAQYNATRGAGHLYVVRSADNGATFGAPVEAGGSPRARGPFLALARTPAGHWALAWTDDRYSEDAVFARASADDGATWGAESRADDAARPGTATMTRGAFAATAEDDLFIGYIDEKDDSGRSRNVRANRTTAAAPSFGPDVALPLLRDAVNTSAAYPHVTTDGASRVYVAFDARTASEAADTWITRSDDGGQTFAAPVLVNAGDAAHPIYASAPRALAVDDGHVYVVFGRLDTNGNERLMFRRSSDSGATWSDATDLGPARDYFQLYDSAAEHQLEAGPDGQVYVAWTDQKALWFARSDDFGATFTTTNLEPSASAIYSPALCANGSTLVLTYVMPDMFYAYWVEARTSVDGGVTWSAPQSLQEPTSGGLDNYLVTRLACDGNSLALSTWATGSGAHVRRWNGTLWEPEQQIDFGETADDARPLFTSPGHAVIVSSGGSWAWDKVWSNASDDGGQTFGAPQRLDVDGPRPEARSVEARVAGDGHGHLWAIWRDSSAGRTESIAVRYSGDDGHTWGPMYRANRETPQGGKINGPYVQAPAAALGGRAIIAWSGQRASSLPDLLVNVYDPADLDRDGAPAATDCNDADPGARAVPAEVGALTVARSGDAALLAWPDMSGAGPSTVYDIATGSVGDLRATGGFGAATCAASGLGATSFLDDRGGPAPTEARYELVRATNSCGAGTWGPAVLDLSGPCP